MAEVNPLEQFLTAFSTSLAEDTFVRLVLSGPRAGGERPERVLGRLVEIRKLPHLSLTLRFPTKDVTRNLTAAEAAAWLRAQLGAEFQSALLCTIKRDWQLAVPEAGLVRLVTHRPSIREVPSRGHDVPKRDVLDLAAREWLVELGVTDARGKVRPAMTDKFRQINHYLEILSHLAADCGWRGDAKAGASGGAISASGANESAAGVSAKRELVFADMGCGKGYLTFGAWHLFNRQLRIPTRVLGVEARPELVTAANALARRTAAGTLEFAAGEIATAPLPPSVDALIALHACNTATDDAIRRGVALGAKLILVSPCCHKEVRPQLTHPAVLAGVLRHGAMEERVAEWVTDGLRALYLEAAGYETKIAEFVATEHTARNLLISAVRIDATANSGANASATASANAAPSARAQLARKQIVELKNFFGIQHHALDALLTTTPENRDASAI